MKTNKIAIILPLIILVLLTICLMTWKNNQTAQIAPPPNFLDVTQPTNGSATTPDTATPQAVNLPKDTGTVSTSTKGVLLYTNEKVGVSFLFPQGWHLGNNLLGNGLLQLLNYDVGNYSGKGFSPNGEINKIEAVIDTSNKYEQSSDYPAKSVKEQQVEIAGQKATRTDVELVGGEKERIYYIPMPSTPEKFLSIVIFGDISNFYMLDNLVKSIQWMK